MGSHAVTQYFDVIGDNGKISVPMDVQNSFNQFFKTYNEKFVEGEDINNLYQCMDLAFKWVDMLDIPRTTIRHLYAYEVFTKPNAETFKYFDLIKNTLTNSPQVGDLVVLGTRYGIAGHICIASKKGGVMKFESFDQNWGKPGYCKLVNHTYNLLPNGTLGWLRPKSECDMKIDQVKSIMAANMDNCVRLQNIRNVL